MERSKDKQNIPITIIKILIPFFKVRLRQLKLLVKWNQC